MNPPGLGLKRCDGIERAYPDYRQTTGLIFKKTLKNC